MKSWSEYAAKYNKTHPGRRLIQVAKQRAKLRNIPFELTITEIEIPEICPILGIPLFISQGQGPGGRDNSPSLDRIDPVKGYVDENIWVISHKANSMKFTASKEELKKFAEWIQKNV